MDSMRKYKKEYCPVNITDGDVGYNQVKHSNIDLSRSPLISLSEDVRFDAIF